MKANLNMALGGIAALAWIVTIGFVCSYDPGSPLQPLGGDSVTPKKARAGDVIAVSRSFRVDRTAIVYVTRSMIRGDCRERCEILDLPSGPLVLAPGIYRNIVREQTIPGNADPGTWALRYSVGYEDLLGRTRSASLPPLEIEIE